MTLRRVPLTAIIVSLALAAWALAFGALFAGIGAGIDAVTFRRVIYDTPGGGKATFTLSPLAARQALGARVALEWRRAR